MDTKSALTCIVPNTAEIQSIRQKYDTAFDRWMPHFNIDCFPFFPKERHNELSHKIQSICSRFKPLTINLEKIKCFPCSGKKAGTLYVEVEELDGNLNKLHTQLLDELNIVTKKSFTPHVTLGRFSEQSDMESVMKLLEWSPFSFELKGLNLIIREDNTSFRSSHYFPFGEMEEKISEKYCGTMCNVDEYYIFNLDSKQEDEIVKPKIANYLVIDNSGSMGGATVAATNTIGKGMYRISSDAIDIIPGEIILFSEKVNVIENISNVDDFDKIKFPNQGMSNITEAINVCVDRIVNKHEDAHYIMTFLSDGQHNVGPSLTNEDILFLKNKITENNIKLSVIVVGISSNDTTLGMKIKTCLETVNINSLDSVYYARSFYDMNNVMSKLIHGCEESLSRRKSIKLNVSNGVFIENNSENITTFFSDDNTIMVKSLPGKIPYLYIDGEKIPIEDRYIEVSDVTKAIDSILPKLSQIKIAFGNKSIEQQIAILDNFMITDEHFLNKLNNTNDHDDIGTIKLSSKDRLKILKNVRRSKLSFQEERNKLKLLLVSVSNNSVQQADYLTGFNRKYANKAVLRSDTLSISLDDVIKQIKPELKLALAKDKEKNIEGSSSLLSLNTSLEQHEEWLKSSWFYISKKPIM